MPNKIHITMFGQFSISYRDKRLCENEYRGSKMILLLEYMFYFNDFPHLLGSCVA